MLERCEFSAAAFSMVVCECTVQKHRGTSAETLRDLYDPVWIECGFTARSCRNSAFKVRRRSEKKNPCSNGCRGSRAIQMSSPEEVGEAAYSAVERETSRWCSAGTPDEVLSWCRPEERFRSMSKRARRK